MEKKREDSFFSKNHSAQVTIFIIVAIVIVALGILIYLLYPKIESSLGGGEENPQTFMQNCLEENIAETVGILSSQGGSMNPENYFLYNNEKIEYLCYTNENYKTCIIQQPAIKKHIEKEIENAIKEESIVCFNDMKESYQNRGYEVQLSSGQTKVELLPKRIVTTFSSTLTLRKTNTERYEEFVIVLNNNLYELTSITESILDWEASYGDAETTTYMNYYHDLKVEKLKQTDGTKIYILTDRNSGNKFQFATRSVAWPAGY